MTHLIRRSYFQIIPVSLFLLFQIVGGGLAGCSMLHLSNAINEPFTSAREENKELIRDSSQAPISIEVAQAFVHNQKLHLKVYIQPKIALNPADLVVSVSGLQDGQILQRQVQKVSDVFFVPVLEKNKLVALRFTLNAEGLNEYQVDCRWGDDARELLRKTTLTTSKPVSVLSNDEQTFPDIPSIVSHKVIAPSVNEALVMHTDEQNRTKVYINNLTVDSYEVPCSNTPCSRLFTANATLVNALDQTVSGIELGAGFVWLSGVDSHPSFIENPQTEEQLLLPNLTLLPGEQKKIRVKIDRPVPSLPEGAFVPQLRVIDYTAVR